jgi:hypothetical protein
MDKCLAAETTLACIHPLSQTSINNVLSLSVVKSAISYFLISKFPFYLARSFVPFAPPRHQEDELQKE